MLTDHDFIQTKSIEFQVGQINQNLIFTSQNAVKSVLENQNSDTLKPHPVFCVGSKTRELLQQNGFNVALDADYASERRRAA